MKKGFYFTLKDLFVLKIFKVLFWNFGHIGNQLDKKAKVSFKIMTSQTGLQITAIYILPNSSKSKGNQGGKIGQIREYNVRNIFL